MLRELLGNSKAVSSTMQHNCKIMNEKEEGTEILLDNRHVTMYRNITCSLDQFKIMSLSIRNYESTTQRK